MTQPMKDVDFGGGYLDAGLQDGVTEGAAAQSPDPAALALFERHMGGGGGQGAAGEPSLWAVFDEVLAPAGATMASTDLAPGDAARGAGGAADADASALADTVQQLWVMHGADGRELRLHGLHGLRDLLADTSLRMVEEAGRLAIEFDTGSSESRAWLSQRLRGLAEHLGRHLDRPLRLSVSSAPFARAPDEAAQDSVHWPEDFDA